MIGLQGYNYEVTVQNNVTTSAVRSSAFGRASGKGSAPRQQARCHLYPSMEREPWLPFDLIQSLYVKFPYTQLAARPVYRASSNGTCSDICVYPPRVYLSIGPMPYFFFSWNVFRGVWQPGKNETLNQSWYNAGLSSAMLAEHLFKIDSTSHIF